MMSNPKSKTQNQILRIEESPPALAADAVELFAQLTQQAASEGTLFRVALSGGSTPRLMYGLMASETFRDEIPWDNIRFFFGDERWVPHNHRDSNYKMAKDELFSKLNLDPAHIFPIPTEGLTPEEAAAQYEATLRKEFQVREGEIPEFGLLFLGMGEDGHTASLFPHSPALKERKHLAAANYVEKLSAHRITLTAPVLTAAKRVLFLVTGEDKAAALKEVFQGKHKPEEYPSRLLREARGEVIWFVDRAAASQLRET